MSLWFARPNQLKSNKCELKNMSISVCITQNLFNIFCKVFFCWVRGKIMALLIILKTQWRENVFWFKGQCSQSYYWAQRCKLVVTRWQEQYGAKQRVFLSWASVSFTARLVRLVARNLIKKKPKLVVRKGSN